jgi:hypothetical protein
MSRPSLAALAVLALMTACKEDPAAGGKGDVDGQGGGGEEAETTPLSFDLQDPGDATYTDLVSLPVSGVVDGDDPVVTVNGVVAEVADGTWTVPAAHADVPWPDSPLYPILGEATDAQGGWLRDRVTLAQGESAEAGAPVPAAIGARLTDHALLAFDPIIQDTIAGLDLGELLVTGAPVATILEGDVYVSAASVGAITVDLDFTARGLAYTLVATDVDATLLVDWGIFDTDGDIAVDQIDVEGLVLMGASAGELTLSPLDTSVTITGLEVFGFDDPTGLIDGLLNTFLSDTLADLLEEQVVALADDLLSVLDEITNLELSGMVLNTRFSGVSHDEDGVTIFADTAVSVTEGSMPATRFANPEAPPAISGMTTSTGEPYAVALYLDDDLLSAIGAGLVGSGLLEQEVGGDLGGITLDTTLLGASVPGFDTLPAGEDVTLSISPTLAPLGTAGSAAPEAGRLHIGGLTADFLVPTVQDDPVMTVALDAIVGIGLGEEELLAVDVVDTRATLLSTTLGSTPAEVEPGLQTLIGLAVPLLVGDLLGGALDLSELPVELEPLESGPEGDRAAVYLDIGDVSGLEL